MRLWLPPMGRMMVERLVFDRTGRWPGPLLRRALGLAAGNPLFVYELLRAYRDAGALADAGPELVEARFELGAEITGLDQIVRTHLRQLDEPPPATSWRPWRPGARISASMSWPA